MFYVLYIPGALFGNIGAIVSTVPDFKSNISNGLCGYDASLVGCAVYLFMTGGRTQMVTAMFLSFIAGALHMAFTNILKVLKLPAFTTAFNVTILVAFVSLIKNTSNTLSYVFGGPAPSYPEGFADMSLAFFVDMLFLGVSQFMFINTLAGGVLTVLGIAIVSSDLLRLVT